MACDYMYISKVIYLLIYTLLKVSDVQTFITILQPCLYFISTVYNTVTQLSLAQHIIGGPVRHIVGIIFASGSLLRSYRTHLCHDLTTNKLSGKLNTIINCAYLRNAAKVHYSIQKVEQKCW